MVHVVTGSAKFSLTVIYGKIRAAYPRIIGWTRMKIYCRDFYSFQKVSRYNPWGGKGNYQVIFFFLHFWHFAAMLAFMAFGVATIGFKHFEGKKTPFAVFGEK